MAITHIVLFSFKASLGKAVIDDACSRMLALAQLCLHPESKTPYIVSIAGGKDNSPEGMQGGLTHGFVVHFASAADRDYYVDKDPAHLSFKTSVMEFLDGARVIDFESGSF